MGQDISEAKYLCFPLQKVIAWHKKEVKCLSSKPRDHVEKLIKNKNPDEVGPWTSDELVEHFTLQVLHFLTRDLTPKQAKNMGMEHESTGLLCPSSFISSTWTKKDWFFALEDQQDSASKLPSTAKFPKELGKPQIVEFSYISV